MIAWCPDGAVFHPVQRLCVTQQHAIGPFSEAMKQACEKARGSGARECSEDNWDIFFAGILRGIERCPPGTLFKTDVQACTDSSFAYGPFTLAQVQQCREQNWGFVCEVMRWPLAILRGESAPMAQPPVVPPGARTPLRTRMDSVRGVRGKLLAYYTQPKNYNAVHANVMDWFGTTSNGCVAFMSTALRQVGVHVPRSLNSRGYNISTWTAAFSEYLENTLGWQRISSLTQLEPGDIAFTLDLDGSRSIPAHVFFFVEWDDDSSTWARVIDNQGFLHRRDLAKSNGGSFTPFQYALRPRN